MGKREKSLWGKCLIEGLTRPLHKASANSLKDLNSVDERGE